MRAKEPAENISDIWAAYHDERADSLGTVIPGDSLVDLRKKAQKWWAVYWEYVAFLEKCLVRTSVVVRSLFGARFSGRGRLRLPTIPNNQYQITKKKKSGKNLTEREPSEKDDMLTFRHPCRS